MLPGTGIVLTRPRDQTRSLARKIEAAGGRPILFPALEIWARSPSAESRELLSGADKAIFISANAVEFGLRFAGAGLPAHVLIGAIGQATAMALREQGYGNIIVAQAGFDSEALLATPQMQAVSGERIVIFRGVGGRETLRNVLCQRGAKVEYIECYERRRPDVSAQELNQLLNRDDIAAIHVLSRETLENFCNMIGPSTVETYRRKPVFAPHPAVLEGARILGFSDSVLTGFGDDGVLEALLKRFGTSSDV